MNGFTPSERRAPGVVARLLRYKRVDVIVDDAIKGGIELDIVSVGPALEDLRRRAGSTVMFHGRLADEDVTTLMEGWRAFCSAGKEGFGITPVEANAAGKPVVAFASGGALETLETGGAVPSSESTTSMKSWVQSAGATNCKLLMMSWQLCTAVLGEPLSQVAATRGPGRPFGRKLRLECIDLSTGGSLRCLTVAAWCSRCSRHDASPSRAEQHIPRSTANAHLER
jgi:glycosyl transferase family 1